MSATENPLIFRRASRAIQRRALRKLAECVREKVAAGRPFFCLLTDDRELRRLNKYFLGKNHATDVLSFPSGREKGGREKGNGRQKAIVCPSLGEIAISTGRAAAQAREFGHAMEAEIGILMLHGVLHLMGMDHEKDKGQMRRAERLWRKKLGLPPGLTERVRSC